MKTIRRVSLLCLAALSALAVKSAEPLTVAIFDFASPRAAPSGEGSGLFGGGGDKPAKGDEGRAAAILLNARLSSADGVVLVERAELAKVLGEQELGLSGTVQPETAAKVGRLTGARVLVTGRMFEAGGKHYVVAKIISTETGRVFAESADYAADDGFDAAVGDLAGKIEDVLKRKAGALVAPAEDRDAEMKRLAALVKGKSLPSVAVSIGERHLSSAAIDPAAETEMRAMLAGLGFKVIDTATSTETPEVSITGEAFSELGGRAGNLVSCRARVELKVVRPDTKALLLSDRQTSVAVDLAEHVAAKEALARAAEKLVGRVVPVLVAR